MPFDYPLFLLPLLTVLASGTSLSSLASPLKHQDFEQSPMMTSPDQTISDVIGRNEDIAIFSGFTRDVATVSHRFESNSKNVTVLAPQDAEIRKLPRKPWEDPKDYSTFGANAYDGESGIDRAQRNLERFVEAHVVGQSPWKEKEKAETLAGNTVWFESKGGVKYVGLTTWLTTVR